MFDVSFSELLVLLLVALVVLGPEKLHGVVRTVGRWTGKARVYMSNLTAELERETQAADLKRQLTDAHRILRDSAESAQAAAKDVAAAVKTPPPAPADAEAAAPKQVTAPATAANADSGPESEPHRGGR